MIKKLHMDSYVPCCSHDSCKIIPIPAKSQLCTVIESYDEIISIGFKNDKGGICYMRFVSESDTQITVADAIDTKFVYDKKLIISYVPRTEKKPDNAELLHTESVFDVCTAKSKCFGCNDVNIKEFLFYQRDGIVYVTKTCGIICSTYFQQINTDIGCMECGGETGLFKQLWLSLRPENVKHDTKGIVIRIMYCHNSNECVANIMEKFMEMTKTKIIMECNSCKKPMLKEISKSCGRCRTVNYCSKECQTLDWATHKGICKKMEK